MHKGYTLSYFIRFFNSIPAREFNNYTPTGLAIGEFGAEQRYRALVNFVPNINAAAKNRKLGNTPKARVLRALRNRKANA